MTNKNQNCTIFDHQNQNLSRSYQKLYTIKFFKFNFSWSQSVLKLKRLHYAGEYGGSMSDCGEGRVSCAPRPLPGLRHNYVTGAAGEDASSHNSRAAQTTISWGGEYSEYSRRLIAIHTKEQVGRGAVYHTSINYSRL